MSTFSLAIHCESELAIHRHPLSNLDRPADPRKDSPLNSGSQTRNRYEELSLYTQPENVTAAESGVPRRAAERTMQGGSVLITPTLYD